MRKLVHQRCYRHRRREAVAHCLSCERYFCRECVTEHRGRLLCSDCLAIEAETVSAADGKRALAFWILQFAGGSVVIWFFFYLVGYLLLSIPSTFHEGTIWKQAM